jgi:hypothetical protein
MAMNEKPYFLLLLCSYKRNSFSSPLYFWTVGYNQIWSNTLDQLHANWNKELGCRKLEFNFQVRKSNVTTKVIALTKKLSTSNF